ncbi:HEAT repeat domain-containing protein [Thiohalorhabdus sp.]|uniref:HEAT repeat domain-containing protein n=1 Tax=Thiohalorhabdus sp. TaxID=3094134 RepID=UPI002FC388D3
MLMIFWWTALGLALWSLLAMAFMILRRLWLRRRQRRDEKRRAALKPQLFAWEEGAEPPRLSAHDRRILMELGHNLLKTIRGDDAQRLAQLLQRSGAVAEEIKLLRKGRLPDRAMAAQRLAVFAELEGEARTALEGALDNDRSLNVRLDAARALLEAGQAPALERILERTWHPESISIRGFQALLRQLAASAPEEIRTFLEGNHDPEADHHLLALLTDSLGHSGDLSQLPLLRALATEGGHADIRAAAFRALGSLGHPSARPAVAEGLDDPSWVVRGQAIICASRIGLQELAPRIAKALADPQWWVRLRASQALLQLGPEGLELLRQAAGAEASQRAEESAEATDPKVLARSVLAENGLW